jgi:hypothetical protein
MPTTRTVRADFQWDKRQLRYRRAGKFVSERAVKLAIRRVIRTSQAEMRALGESMARGEIDVAEFQSRFASELKNLHVSAAMAGQGGPANMTSADYLRVGRGLKSQYRYLNNFARQIGNGELNRQQIRMRSEMYIRSSNGAYEGGRRDSAIAAGYRYEKNVLGKNENHCHTGPIREGCIEVTARGWQMIGMMPLPGQRRCLSMCFCSLKFKR